MRPHWLQTTAVRGMPEGLKFPSETSTKANSPSWTIQLVFPQDPHSLFRDLRFIDSINSPSAIFPFPRCP